MPGMLEKASRLKMPTGPEAPGDPVGIISRKVC
ncbi:hypothetical protein R69927_05875 [Paraburkholderia domus]|nr:hypothetical protein R69927_05875 [Paraburkholderia domus]